MSILGHIVRFVVSALVLMVTAWLVPAFSVGGFWSALLLALVIAAIGWAVEALFGTKVTPFSRGIVGFLVSALVIYVAQFFIPSVSISIIGAILAALIIGLIDLFIPMAAPYDSNRKREHA